MGMWGFNVGYAVDNEQRNKDDFPKIRVDTKTRFLACSEKGLPLFFLRVRLFQGGCSDSTGSLNF
jgi:hypothetical protein